MRSARDLDPAETVEWMAKSFEIDAAAGRLFWKIAPKGHPRMLGKEAGAARRGQSGKSYWHIKKLTLPIKRSWLIFLWCNGCWPTECVDHIDGNSLNDSESNIREATVTQNAWNHHKRSRRIDLPMGVRVLPSGRFQARLSVNGKQRHLGSFATTDQASAAYLAERKEAYGEFA